MKKKTLWIAAGLGGLALLLWFGGGALWRFLLAMHGVH